MRKILLGMLLIVASCTSREKKQKENTVAAVQYKLIKIARGGVAADMKFPAQLAAYQEVSIFPKVNGYVKDVLVDIGSRVSKGQLLMVLDVPEVNQAESEQKEKYNKVESDYVIAKENYQRLLEAAETPGAVSAMDISSAKARVKAAEALKNASHANLETQNIQVGYLRITAPFSGVITERNVHPGALVSAAVKDKPMLELKQTDRLRLQVDIPESIAAGLKVNDSLNFRVSDLNNLLMTAVVCRKSGSINAQMRTERIEADVINKGNLASGMYVDVAVHSNGNTSAFHAPRSAVVTTTLGKYVIAVRNKKAVKVNVTTGAESADEIEFTGDVLDNDSIILNASEDIDDGVSIN